MIDSVAPAATEPLPADFHPPGKRYLGRGTRYILRAMTDVLLPRNEKLRVECTDDLVNFVDNFVRYLPPLLKLGFPIGVWIFQFAAILWSGLPLPFTMLSRERQERYMAGWTESRFWWKRDMMKGLKGVVLMGFYQHPEVMRHIHYDPVSHVQTIQARRLATYGDDIRRRQSES